MSAALLGAGVAAQLACVAGVVLMRGPFDKLHYAAAGSTLGPLLVGAAVALDEPTTAGRLQAGVTVLLVFLLSPALTIATARAARATDG